MPTDTVCPACGALVAADTAFCGECDSLVSSTAVQRPAARALMPSSPSAPRPVSLPPRSIHTSVAPTPAPPITARAAESARVPPAPREVPLSPFVTCWDCDSENPSDRLFCSECGTFIAIGSKVFSGGAYAGDAVAMPATPGGSMSLGSYSVAMRRRAAQRRVLMGAVSVVLVAIVGLASIYVATSPNGPERPAPAVLAAASSAPASIAPDETAEVMGPAIANLLELAEIEEQLAPEPVVAEDELAVEEEPTAPEEPTAREEPATREEPAVPGEPVTPDAAALPAEPDVPEEPAEPTTPEDPAVPEELAIAPADVPSAKPAEPDPPAEPEPADAPAILPVVEADEPDFEPIPAREPDPEPEAVAPEQENPAVWQDGWVCDGELQLQDERLRDWTITRVSFLPGDGYERVILHVDRYGSGSGEVASVAAEAFPTSRVVREVPGVRQPSSGRTTVALQFRDGLKTDVTLRGYKPAGLQTVKEFSAFPAGNGASRVLISASAEGCFKVRVPAWTSRAQQGQIHVDIKS